MFNLTQKRKEIVDGSLAYAAIEKHISTISTKEIDPYKSTNLFIKKSEKATQDLPVELRRKIIKFKRFSNDEGYLLIKSLKVIPENLFETPNKETVISGDANKRDYLSEFWLSSIGSLLGDVFGYAQESKGYLFHNVRPVKQNEDKLSSQSSKILLDFHTETAFHPLIPDFLMLFCLRQDREKQAATIVSSIRYAIKELDEDTINILRSKSFRTGIDFAFGNISEEKGNGDITSVLYGDPNDPLMKFDPDLMIGLTKEAENALLKLKEAVDKHKKAVILEPGDLLIVDNRRAVHGRAPFKAYYDGKDRWLQRSYVCRDLLLADILFSKKERSISYSFEKILGKSNQQDTADNRYKMFSSSMITDRDAKELNNDLLPDSLSPSLNG